jgi:class 3 adenylate cyclase/pimeloyl-ACP methyl ester carboxylesterase
MPRVQAEPPRRPDTLSSVAPSTKTRYAKAGDVDVAYQVIGDGPLDLLLGTGFVVPIDCMDDEPAMARFQRRLASFSRLIRFDVRGTGLSERGLPAESPGPLTIGEGFRDCSLAVLDAVGSEQAALLTAYIASPGGITLAATNPERVSHLVLVNAFARLLWASDYPSGVDQSTFDSSLRLGIEPDAVEQGRDILAITAPSVANDPAFRAWWDRSGNLGMTPTMVGRGLELLVASDVRSLLPPIRVPTLVIQRADVLWGPGRGRYLADHIGGAKYVELPGADLPYWVGDTGPMLDEIEEFVTGVRGGSGAERILATVLFTDIVGSTDRAAQLGDSRWRDLLEHHDQSVRTQIERFRGHAVKSVGDGFVATFDSPGRAIECALGIREALGALDLDMRAGIHTGEIEVRGSDVAGMAVHIAARVSAIAGPSELLVSSTVKDLVIGSNVEFADRGEYELKGVPGSWRLFAVAV